MLVAAIFLIVEIVPSSGMELLRGGYIPHTVEMRRIGRLAGATLLLT
jgi:hypothetical protein